MQTRKSIEIEAVAQKEDIMDSKAHENCPPNIIIQQDGDRRMEGCANDEIIIEGENEATDKGVGQPEIGDDEFIVETNGNDKDIMQRRT